MPSLIPPPGLSDTFDFSEFFAKLDRNYVPHVSVNCVVFAYQEGRLHVLLHHLDLGAAEQWGLPAAYVRQDESTDDAANSLLTRMVGLEDAFISQFHTFGAKDRVGPAARLICRTLGIEPPPGHWALGRVISVGYFSLVDVVQAKLTTATSSEEYVWKELTQIPELALDHNAMVRRALATLRMQLDSLPLDKALSGKEFTMSELQRFYEAAHDKKFDRRNFKRRMVELGLVEQLQELRTGGAHRPAYLYRWVGQTSTYDELT